MMSSSIGPSGVEVTGLTTSVALWLELPQRPNNPERCFAVVVCVEDVSEWMLGDGDTALEVAGVA
jgi:hypothetical protein